jgi:hypothetical protein
VCDIGYPIQKKIYSKICYERVRVGELSRSIWLKATAAGGYVKRSALGPGGNRNTRTTFIVE